MASSSNTGINSAEVVVVSNSDATAKQADIEPCKGKAALTTMEEQDYAAAMEIINAGCDLAWLKWKHCQAYLKRHGLRVTDKKAVLIDRIQEHLELKGGGAQAKYPVSTFVLDCQGQVCIGDVVLFKQQLYEEKFDEFLRRRCPPLGTRTVAGRVINDSCGILKQQRTITLEVLWSTGAMPLPPLQGLRFKGHDFCSIKVLRQPWQDEEKRKQILQERISIDSLPAGISAVQIEPSKKGSDNTVSGDKMPSQGTVQDCRDVHAVSDGRGECKQQEAFKMPAQIDRTRGVFADAANMSTITKIFCSDDGEPMSNPVYFNESKPNPVYASTKIATEMDFSTDINKLENDYVHEDDTFLQFVAHDTVSAVAKDSTSSFTESSIGSLSTLKLPIEMPLQLNLMKHHPDENPVATHHIMHATENCKEFLNSTNWRSVFKPDSGAGNQLENPTKHPEYEKPVASNHMIYATESCKDFVKPTNCRCVFKPDSRVGNQLENPGVVLEKIRNKAPIPEKYLSHEFFAATEPHKTLIRTTQLSHENADQQQFNSPVSQIDTCSNLAQAHSNTLLQEVQGCVDVPLQDVGFECGNIDCNQGNSPVLMYDMFILSQDSKALPLRKSENVGYGTRLSQAMQDSKAPPLVKNENAEYVPRLSQAMQTCYANSTILQVRAREEDLKRIPLPVIESSQSEKESMCMRVKIKDFHTFETVISKEAAAFDSGNNMQGIATVELDKHMQGSKNYPFIIQEEQSRDEAKGLSHSITEIAAPKCCVVEKLLNAVMPVKVENNELEEKKACPGQNYPKREPHHPNVIGSLMVEIPAKNIGTKKRKGVNKEGGIKKKRKKMNSCNQGNKTCKGIETSSVSNTISFSDRIDAMMEQGGKLTNIAEVSQVHHPTYSPDQQMMEQVKYSSDKKPKKQKYNKAKGGILKKRKDKGNFMGTPKKKVKKEPQAGNFVGGKGNMPKKGSKKRKFVGEERNVPSTVKAMSKTEGLGHVKKKKKLNTEQGSLVAATPSSLKRIPGSAVKEISSIQQKSKQQNHYKGPGSLVTENKTIQKKNKQQKHYKGPGSLVTENNTTQKKNKQPQHSKTSDVHDPSCIQNGQSLASLSRVHKSKVEQGSEVVAKPVSIKRIPGSAVREDNSAQQKSKQQNQYKGPGSLVTEDNTTQKKNKQQHHSGTNVLHNPSSIQSVECLSRNKKKTKKAKFVEMSRKNESHNSMSTTLAMEVKGSGNYFQKSYFSGAIFCQRPGCLNLRPKNCITNCCRKCCKKMGENCSRHKKISNVS